MPAAEMCADKRGESIRILPASAPRRGALCHAAQHALARHFPGYPEELPFNAQELTVVPLGDGRPWAPVERLRQAPGGPFADHPHTICPLARLPDGRFILLFTNNDGTRNSAGHAWDGDCRTRNPQGFAIGRELPGETRNGGPGFGPPRILTQADETESPDDFRPSTCPASPCPGISPAPAATSSIPARKKNTFSSTKSRRASSTK
jgi:hypothetical protein